MSAELRAKQSDAGGRASEAVNGKDKEKAEPKSTSIDVKTVVGTSDVALGTALGAFPAALALALPCLAHFELLKIYVRTPRPNPAGSSFNRFFFCFIFGGFVM